MSSKAYHLPSIGDILISKHPRAKRLKIILKPGKPPKVVIPFLVSFDAGLRFALEKSDWIQTHLEKVKFQPTLYNTESELKCRFSTIKIARNKGVKPTKKDLGNIKWLYIPESANIESEPIQTLIRNFYIQQLRREAAEYLPERVKMLASQHQFKYNKVTIKLLSSRWGSCSSVNNINLNLHLMRLPEHLSDFIILHELCHTVHKNHGPHFHSLLNKISGHEKAFDKELRNYRIHF